VSVGLIGVSRGASAGRRMDVPALVPIRRAGHRRPFFCVTASYGDVLTLARLARLMEKTRPFYVLQPPVTGGRHPAEGLSLAGLAAHHVSAIRQVQPEGPYLLGGLSVGGIVALEIAHQLRAAGSAVDLLLALDAPVTVNAVRYWLFRLGVGRLQRLFPEPREGEPRIVTIVRALLIDEGFQAQMLSARGYRPAPYDGALASVIASDRLNLLSFSFAKQWRRIARGRCDIYEVPGNHDTFVRAPHVEGLAALMDRCLDDAERRA
jgi:thioesterase domain-containing protein